MFWSSLLIGFLCFASLSEAQLMPSSNMNPFNKMLYDVMLGQKSVSSLGKLGLIKIKSEAEKGDRSNGGGITFWCKNRAEDKFALTKIDDPNINQKIDLSKPVYFFIHAWMSSIRVSYVQNLLKGK